MNFLQGLISQVTNKIKILWLKKTKNWDFVVLDINESNLWYGKTRVTSYKLRVTSY